MEPSRRYHSEPDLAACRSRNYGASKSKCSTMVNQLSGMSQNLNDDVSSNASSVAEGKSFLEVDFCDEAAPMEPLRRYHSEPDLAACRRRNYGTSKSKCSTMVNQLAGMSQNLNDGVPNNGFNSQHSSKMPGWHLCEFEDEEIASFGENPVPDPMENLVDDTQQPRKRKSRPCKGQRVRYRKFMEKMVRLVHDDPDGFELDEVSVPPGLAPRTASIVAYLQSEKARILKDRASSSSSQRP